MTTRTPSALRSPLPAARGGVLRVLAAVWLVMYGMLGLGVPLLDASTEHTDRVVAHWEDASETDCPATHETGCTVCQLVVQARAVPAQGAGELPVIVRREPTPQARTAADPAQVARTGHSTRAPPAV